MEFENECRNFQEIMKEQDFFEDDRSMKCKGRFKKHINQKKYKYFRFFSIKYQISMVALLYKKHKIQIHIPNSFIPICHSFFHEDQRKKKKRKLGFDTHSAF